MRIGVAAVALLVGMGPMSVARAAGAAPLVYEYSVQGRGNTSDLEEFAAAAA